MEIILTRNIWSDEARQASIAARRASGAAGAKLDDYRARTRNGSQRMGHGLHADYAVYHANRTYQGAYPWVAESHGLKGDTPNAIVHDKVMERGDRDGAQGIRYLMVIHHQAAALQHGLAGATHQRAADSLKARGQSKKSALHQEAANSHLRARQLHQKEAESYRD